MDDLRFDALPRAQAFEALIDAIASAAPLPSVVAAAALAGEPIWRRVIERDVLGRARTAISAAPEVAERANFSTRLATLAERLEALRGKGAWDDADEIATLAVLEGYAESIATRAARDGVKDAEEGARTTRAILARLGARLIAYVLDRELPQHVGERRRFRSVAALHAFRIAVEAHVRAVVERALGASNEAQAEAPIAAQVEALRAALGAGEAR
jgi:hypothetical protein